jgi:hypothetical protein
MKTEIDFPFYGYTKHDVIVFCFGPHADVDSALPQELFRKIQLLYNDANAPRWFVMDYTENKAFGKLVNLKEKFFDKVAQLSIEQLPSKRN